MRPFVLLAIIALSLPPLSPAPTRTPNLKVATNAAPATADSTACVATSDLPPRLPKVSPEQERRFGKTLMQQVKAHQACVGMSKEVLIASWGLPPTMRVQRQGADRYDVWEYPSHIVFLKNSIVTGVR